MYRNKKISAIIPARGGSKRLPNKNIKPLAGKPLIVHTIRTAIASRVFDRVIVSTDSERIAAIARAHGAEVPFMRPKALARDTSVGWHVLQHAVKTLREKEGYEPDFAASLSVCSPLRNTQDIKKCINVFIDKKAHFVRSAVAAKGNPYFNLVEVKGGHVSLVKPPTNTITQSQKAPKVYQINDSINVFSLAFLFKHDVIVYDKNTHIVAMPHERSVDIDEEIDFVIAEVLYQQNYA